MHVDWNGSPLYDEDHKDEKDFDSQYSYDLGWDVPSFAPNGKYNVTLTGTGACDDCPSDGDCKVLCINAQFEFS